MAASSTAATRAWRSALTRRSPSSALAPDPETGAPTSVSHLLPRSVADLQRRNRCLSRISEATVGLMGRTPDYMNVKFACFAARRDVWAGAGGGNAEGADNLVRFQRRLAQDDLSLTHTIIQPTVDKATDSLIVGQRAPLHKVGETAHGIVVRGARILATLAPFADEIAVYPGLPIPAGAEAYALAFALPVDTPGLIFLCRDSASAPDADPFDRPLSSRFDEQDAFVIFDDVEVPRERVFLAQTLHIGHDDRLGTGRHHHLDVANRLRFQARGPRGIFRDLRREAGSVFRAEVGGQRQQCGALFGNRFRCLLLLLLLLTRAFYGARGRLGAGPYLHPEKPQHRRNQHHQQPAKCGGSRRAFGCFRHGVLSNSED